MEDCSCGHQRLNIHLCGDKEESLAHGSNDAALDKRILGQVTCSLCKCEDDVCHWNLTLNHCGLPENDTNQNRHAVTQTVR